MRATGYVISWKSLSILIISRDMVRRGDGRITIKEDIREGKIWIFSLEFSWQREVFDDAIVFKFMILSIYRYLEDEKTSIRIS